MPVKTKLDWKIYESITKYIYEELGRKSGVKVLGYGNSCKVQGKSGVEHQIDILTFHTDGIHSYRTAIECKYWKEKINKEIVMKISNIIEDAGIEKGVIVSKNGFTPDGADFAKYKNISIVELKESEETDEKKQGQLQIGTLQISTNITIRRPEITGVAVDYVSKESVGKEAINIYQTTITLPKGNQILFTEFTTAFQNELHAQNKIGKTITKRYEVPGGSLLHIKNSSPSEFKGLVFKGVLKQIDSKSNQTFSLEDQVWLIMKLIFEGKSFSISEYGIIVENKN